MNRSLRRQRGFTLLEMMVVVAIIAILASILIPNFTRARAQAQTAACIGNMKTIATALELYYTDKQIYPVATDSNIDPTFTTTTMSGYLSLVPRDPAAPPGTYYTLTTTAASGNAGVAGYTIWCPGSHDPSTLQNIAPANNKHAREIRQQGRFFGCGRAGFIVDWVSTAVRSMEERDAFAPLWAFLAGGVTSLGPCTAPRVIALTSLIDRRTQREAILISLAYTAGLTCGYALYVIAASFIWRLLAHSFALYVLLATMMLGSGAAMLWSAGRCTHSRSGYALPPGAVYLAGLLSAITVSPCCTPFVFAASAYLGTSTMLFATGVLAAFSLGHMLPLLFGSFCAFRAAPVFTGRRLGRALRVIAGGVLVAVGGYYAVLA